MGKEMEAVMGRSAKPRAKPTPLAAALMLCCLLARAEGGLGEHVARGFEALDRNRPEEALVCFLKARRENPESAPLQCYVGLGYFKTGNREAALEFFERAARSDGSIVDSAFLFYRASCYRALGLPEIERRGWQAVIEWDPASSFADAARKALTGTGRRAPPVRRLLEAGLDAWNTYPHAATAYFREAVTREGSEWRAEARVFLACSLNSAGRYEEVLALDMDIAGGHALGAVLRLQHAMALVGLGRWKPALSVLARIDHQTTVAAQSEYLKALCLIEIGREDEAAISLVELSKPFGKEMINSLISLAEIHMRRRSLRPQ